MALLRGVSGGGKKDVSPPQTRPIKMQPDDFQIERLIGEGNFSEVLHVSVTPYALRRLGQDLPEGLKNVADGFAMKRINKARLRQRHKERDVIMEKHCLNKLQNHPVIVANLGDTSASKVLQINAGTEKNASLPVGASETSEIGADAEAQGGKVQSGDRPYSHPNICRLCGTFQDDSHLYIITEYCSRGELLDIVNGVGILDPIVAKFYIAQLVNALEYMHRCGIVHRDLKCENLLISSQGLLKVIDFGTALDLDAPDMTGAGNRSPGIHGRTFDNYVGTPQFMPPEAIRNKASGRYTDLWSLGCTIYQILAGRPAFEGPSEFLVYLEVTKGIITFPPHFPPLAADLITKLVKVNPEERLGWGDGGDLKAIKSHPYFKGVDFTKTADILRVPSTSSSPLNSLETAPEVMIEIPPIPPLWNLCLNHACKNWMRFQEKFEAAGWNSQYFSSRDSKHLQVKPSNDPQPSEAKPPSDILGNRDSSKAPDLTGVDDERGLPDCCEAARIKSVGGQEDAFPRPLPEGLDVTAQTPTARIPPATDFKLLVKKSEWWHCYSEPGSIEMLARELAAASHIWREAEIAAALERLDYYKWRSSDVGPRSSSYWEAETKRFLATETPAPQM